MKGSTVSIVNCQINKAIQVGSSDYEILDVQHLRMNQQETTTVKAVEVLEQTSVTRMKLKNQDYMVANACSSSRIVLWEDDISKTSAHFRL